jgi:hypothetical protein
MLISRLPKLSGFGFNRGLGITHVHNASLVVPKPFCQSPDVVIVFRQERGFGTACQSVFHKNQILTTIRSPYLSANHFPNIKRFGIVRATFHPAQAHQGEKRIPVKPMFVVLRREIPT